MKVVCPKIIGFNLDGYNEGVGQISLFAFFISGTTLIKHYIKWRGDAFSSLDKSTWPVSEAALEVAITSIKKSSVANEESIVKLTD